MSCDLDEDIILYHYNELPAERRERLKLHLEKCEECRSSLQALKAADNWLEETTPVIPDSVKSAIMKTNEFRHINIRQYFKTVTNALIYTAAAVSLLIFCSFLRPDRHAKGNVVTAELLEASITEIENDMTSYDSLGDIFTAE